MSQPRSLEDIPRPAHADRKSVPTRVDAQAETIEIHRLVDARLLVVESRAGGERVAELVHESLIGGWPTLIGWLDENRDDAAFLSRLRTAAAQWQASDRDDGVLWRDEPARRALAWLAHYRGDLGRRERAYLDAVRDVTMRAERRRRRVRRQVIAAAVAVPVILLAVAGVALVRISRAEREASQQRDELRIEKANAERAAREAQEARLAEAVERAKKNTKGPVTHSGTIYAAISPAGDEDVFPFMNPSASTVTMKFDTWSQARGIGFPCDTDADTVLYIRNAIGTLLVANSDRDPGHDFCSTATITVAAGETVYVHVRAFNADAVIPGYLLVATYVP